MALEINKKAMILGGGILLCGSLVAIALSSIPSEIELVKDQKELYAEKFTNLPEGTTAKIEYISQKDIVTRSIMIESENHVTSAADDDLKADQYMASYVLKTPSDNIDIILEIDKNKNFLIADLSGLPTHSAVGLNIQNFEYLPKTPSDWSGRFRINLQNLAEIKDKNICLTIEGLLDNKQSTICHHVSDTMKEQVAS